MSPRNGRTPLLNSRLSARVSAGLLLGGLILLALPHLASCSQLGPRFEPAETHLLEPEVQVALRLVHHVPLVPVRIGGAGPYWFLLDTGAEATVLSTKLSRELGIPLRRSAVRVIGAEERSSDRTPLARVRSLEISQAVFGPFDALVLDLEPLERSLGCPLDGILGFNTFSHCLLILDYPAAQVTLAAGRLQMDASGEVLPLSPATRPTVRVTIGEHLVSLVIDSGSAETLALPRELSSSIPFANGPVAAHPGTTITGRTGRSQVGRLGVDVQLGPHTLLHPVVYLTEHEARLGGELLRNFRVTFDRASSLVRLSKNESAPVRTAGLRTPGFSLRRESVGWVVEDVLPGTRAAVAGLRRADLLVSVNGLPAPQMTGERWRRLLDAAEVVVLVIERDGVHYRAEVPVLPLVP